MRLFAKRSLAIFLSVIMVLSVMMVGTATAFAADGTELFLATNTEWATDGARFAAYFYAGETNTWADVTAVEGKDNLYTVTVPEGEWTNVIFCRMNPEFGDNGWNSDTENNRVWNQTGNLDMPTDGKNCFALDAGWNCTGVWGTYADGNITTDPTEPAKSNIVYFVDTQGWGSVNGHIWTGSGDITTWPGNPATLVEENVYSFDVLNATGLVFHNNAGTQTGDIEISADKIGQYYEPKTNGFYATAQEAFDAAVNATDPTYDFEYFVVGTEGLIPGAWNETPRAETAMTKGEDGIYKLVINNAPVGNYEIKVKGVDGAWYPEGIDNETPVNVEVEGSEVVITFDPAEGFCRATVNGQGVNPTDPTESTPVGDREYTLCGWINGAAVADEDDYANVVPEYTFKDGKVTVTFAEDSYIRVKTTDNAVWYGTVAFEEGITSATMIVNGEQKLKVPAGTFTITLVVNEDGSLNVSYAPADDDEPSEPSQPTEPTSTEPTTVKPAPKTTITLTKASAVVYVKGTTTIKATVKNGKGTTTYTTSNKKVATVDAKGKVKAIKAGKATITVTNNGVKKTFKVTVKKPTLNKKKVTLKKGKKFTLKVKGLVGKATFTTSKKTVATVSKKGKITAKKKGSATINVKANGIKLKCKVTVK